MYLIFKSSEHTPNLPKYFAYELPNNLTAMEFASTALGVDLSSMVEDTDYFIDADFDHNQGIRISDQAAFYLSPYNKQNVNIGDDQTQIINIIQILI